MNRYRMPMSGKLVSVVAVIAATVLLGGCGSRPSHPDSSTASAAPGLSASITTTSPTPALDCARSTVKAQQLVCNDPELTVLDRRAQTAYQQALARPGADQSTLATAQNAFMTVRDGCTDRVDVRTCLVEAYQTRLVELAIADPATVAPPVVTYNCPPGDGPLTAQFYNDLDPKAAVLNWKGTRIILFVQPSGSGARYSRQGSEYWEHQGEVRLNLNGINFVCHTQ